MKRFWAVPFCGLGFLICGQASFAGSLEATPTSLDVTYPAQTTLLTVRGNGEGTTAGQVRVLRWLQHDGVEQLLPTRDVMASPPAMRLEPGKQMTVRLVRTIQKPIQGEECYRVLVDQLPGAEQNGIAVKFTIRHSIPLCFDSGTQQRGQIQWNLARKGKALILSATNSGQRRIVAKQVTVSAVGGADLKLPSVVVLGNSTMSWELKGKTAGFKSGARVTIRSMINGKPVAFQNKINGGA